MRKNISFILNGKEVSAEVEPSMTLLELLREEFGLIGTKEGCGYGECGACTVIMDDKSVNSCLVLAIQADDKNILTVEGLASEDGTLHPLQKAFVEHGAVQCGFCTPGMLMSAKALLDEKPQPTEKEIRAGMAGNLCRCTGYVKIVEAIKAVSEEK